jgi:hypothetical protein
VATAPHLDTARLMIDKALALAGGARPGHPDPVELIELLKAGHGHRNVAQAGQL